MKIDIEKLERKTPYEIPESFFEEVQSKVLQETLSSKPTKRFSLHFTWAVAAAVALIVGLVFLVQSNNNDTLTPDLAQNTTTTSKASPVSESDINQSNTESAAEENQIIEEINAADQHLTSAKKTNLKEEQKQSLVLSDAKSNINIDELLSSMSQEELNELSKMSEQDIFLDLYN